MLPRLPRELWLPKFASEWMAEQPRFPPRLANEVAAYAWERLQFLAPRQAVLTLLAVAASVLQGGAVASGEDGLVPTPLPER